MKNGKKNLQGREKAVQGNVPRELGDRFTAMCAEMGCKQQDVLSGLAELWLSMPTNQHRYNVISLLSGQPQTDITNALLAAADQIVRQALAEQLTILTDLIRGASTPREPGNP